MIGLKFIESLMKNNFSMFAKDSDGVTPMGYLLTEAATEDAILPVI